MAPRYSRLGGGLALLSLAHLVFLTPPKLVGLLTIREYVFLVPITGVILVAQALRATGRVRYALMVGLVPLIVSIKTYSFAGSCLERARREQARARIELVGSKNGATFAVRRGGEPGNGEGCEHVVHLRHITICSPSLWRVRHESTGEDFPKVDLWSTDVAGVSLVVAEVAVDSDQSPFGPAVVQLRRVSSFVRHHKGAVLLVMDGLPGMFSGATIGFYEQAAVRELWLPIQFWRSVVGIFPVRLLTRGVRFVEEERRT